MNEKGWGLKDFLLILAIIFFALLITVVIYKVSFKKDEPVDPIEPKTKTVSFYESYSDMEDAIKMAGIRHQNDHYQGELESNETWVLSYKLLLKDDYLKHRFYDISDTDDECNGYVVFEKKGSNISYYPYIKCKYYKTIGYDSTKEE